MRTARFDRKVLVAVVLSGGALATGCTVGPPMVPVPGNGADLAAPLPSITYADSIITYSKNGTPMDCTSGEPDCHKTLEQTGACANLPVTGMNDGNTLNLDGGDNIVIGFTCSSITEVGLGTTSADGAFGPSADFRVWGTVSGPESNLPVVEVSIDAVNWTNVNLWGGFQQQGIKLDHADFDLESAIQSSSMSLTLVRYVRITQNVGGTSSIDAIEAFRGQP